MRNRWWTLAFAVLAPVTVTSTALAVDGQIAITQARAMAGGVTPGDTPGFPVTISLPGSYVLSSNLIVPNADTAAAILIAASHVTLDLNGFAILGPTDCSGGLNPCAGSGTGLGITTNLDTDPSNTPQFNITIRNGTVQGMGHFGIFLRGDSHLIEYVHVRSNGGAGLVILASGDLGSSLVQHCTAQRNATYGVLLDSGAVRNTVADVNGGDGIYIDIGSASSNVATRNSIGLSLGVGAAGFGNTMRDNSAGNFFARTNGANLGQNFCSGRGGGC